MTWTRLSDDLANRQAFLSASRNARLLHIEGLMWCNDQLTDGHLSRVVLRRITDTPDLDENLAELVEAGLWSTEDEGASFHIDWSDQETAERVQARRSDRAEIQRRYRERGELHAKGDHRQCTSRCPKQGQVTGNAMGLVTTSVTASRPDPTRPLGRGERGTRADAPSAGAPGALRVDNEMPAPVTFHITKPAKAKRSA